MSLMNRKSIAALAALLAVGAAQAKAQPPASAMSPVVVELFTSQGCSSCPPADRVLASLAQRPDVLALSFHVNYWDNLGWKDPFGSPANTERQKAYRLTFNNAQIYTPQMVVGGASEMVGQDARAVTAAIAEVTARRQAGPGLVIGRGNQTAVTVEAAKNTAASTIWIAAYVPRVETAVARGENAGRALVNTNVVRALRALGPYAGAAMTVAVPPGFARDDEGIAAWIQTDPTGIILSAANAPPAMP